MFRWLFKKLSTVWRWVNPNAQTAQAMFIRIVASDLVRSYLQRNPKTTMHLHAINAIVSNLRRIVDIKESTAERIIRSIVHELGILAD